MILWKMNSLHKVCSQVIFRNINTETSVTANLLVEPLSKRSLIRLQGNEVVPFLQGLITNDMNHLAVRGVPSIYSLFLNKQGRILYDSIVYKTPDPNTFLIECEKSMSNDLRRHLRMFRVRRKIEVDCIEKEFSPWVIFNPNKDGPVESDVPVKVLNEISTEMMFCPDPRLKDLGVRIILPVGFGLSEIQKVFKNQNVDMSNPKLDYKYHRLGLGVGEGSDDHLPAKAFPMESNADFLHGLSFQKGCYLGQEVTARTYHTGVIRKRLMPLNIQNAVPEDTLDVKSINGTVVGSLRSYTGKRGLALLRVENVLNSTDVTIDGEPASVYVPEWWPKSLPKRVSLKE